MFTQEIRWSPQAQWAIGGLLLVTTAVTLAPAFFLPPGHPDRARAVVIGVVVGAASSLVVWIFMTLRVTVDDQALTVGFGPLKERVPLERITSCRPTTYRWFDWGGWGIRLGWRAKLYNVPGDGGVAAEVTLDGGRRVLFSSPDPAAVCRALRERRSEIAGC